MTRAMLAALALFGFAACSLPMLTQPSQPARVRATAPPRPTRTVQLPATCNTSADGATQTCVTTLALSSAASLAFSGLATDGAGNEASFGPTIVPFCLPPEIARKETTVEISWTCPATYTIEFSATTQPAPITQPVPRTP